MALFDRKFHVSQVFLYKRPGPLTSTGKGPQELDHSTRPQRNQSFWPLHVPGRPITLTNTKAHYTGFSFANVSDLVYVICISD